MSTSPLPGPKVLLQGATGVGKTTAIRTLIDAGVTPFCIFTEPGFDVLGDLPQEKLHWHYIPPATAPWDSLKKSADAINKLPFKALTEMVDPERAKYRQAIEFLECCNNFKCQRDGKNYGDVAKWNTDRAIVVDGLTGLGMMSLHLQIGGKPVKNQSEWGIAQDNLERWVAKLCTDTAAAFILIAHIERETDEVLGGSKIMASTLGKKLAPKLPRFFGDVVMAVRAGTEFSWTTALDGADLKSRNLPVRDGLEPSFVPIYDTWKKHGGVICPTGA